MGLQTFIALLVVAAALVVATIVFIRKIRSFSMRPSCSSNCGCGDSGKNLTS